MRQIEIDSFNSSIYEDGKIFNTPTGYSSKLMQRLYGHGYRAVVSGVVHTLYDDKRVKVCTAYSWLSLLMNTARILK